MEVEDVMEQKMKQDLDLVEEPATYSANSSQMLASLEKIKVIPISINYWPEKCT